MICVFKLDRLRSYDTHEHTYSANVPNYFVAVAIIDRKPIFVMVQSFSRVLLLLVFVLFILTASIMPSIAITSWEIRIENNKYFLLHYIG